MMLSVSYDEEGDMKPLHTALQGHKKVMGSKLQNIQGMSLVVIDEPSRFYVQQFVHTLLAKIPSVRGNLTREHHDVLTRDGMPVCRLAVLNVTIREFATYKYSYMS